MNSCAVMPDLGRRIGQNLAAGGNEPLAKGKVLRQAAIGLRVVEKRVSDFAARVAIGGGGWDQPVERRTVDQSKTHADAADDIHAVAAIDNAAVGQGADRERVGGGYCAVEIKAALELGAQPVEVKGAFRVGRPDQLGAQLE